MIPDICHEDLSDIYSDVSNLQAVDMSLPLISEDTAKAVYVLRYARIKLLHAGHFHESIPVMSFVEVLSGAGVPFGVAQLLEAAIAPMLEDLHTIDAVFLENMELKLIGEELLANMAVI